VVPSRPAQPQKDSYVHVSQEFDREGHGLIERIPRTHRYQVTDTGLRHAMFLTRVHDRVLLTGIAQLNSPAPAALRQADRAYHAAISDLTRSAGLAA